MTTLALLTWPFVTLFLVLRYPFPIAAVISVLGGFFLLPPDVGINLPVLPALSKDTIPALSLLLLALLIPGRINQGKTDLVMPGWVPKSALVVSGLLLVGIGALVTALVNGDRIVYGPTTLPGMGLYDGMAQALTSLTMLVPLLLGRKFFAHPDQHALLVRGLILGGVVLSLPTLLEIRISPQLNAWVYGYYSSGWVQNLRGGAFRPVVFMDHGLQLALFFAMVAVAAFGAFRALGAAHRRFFLLAGVWCLTTLVLSNSFGALATAIVFLPAALLLGRRMQLLFAAGIAAVVLLYPMLRGADLIPTDRIITVVTDINPGRAVSLQFRLNQEDVLLEHARERPILGWGGWRRNRVFNADGQDISTTDGAWIIAFGRSGWVGYLGLFGLLSLPVVLLGLKGRSFNVAPATTVLALVVAVALIDLIPNGFLFPFTLLMVGAIWGRLELGRDVKTVTQAIQPTGVEAAAERLRGRDRPVYSRQKTHHQRVRKSPY